MSTHILMAATEIMWPRLQGGLGISCWGQFAESRLPRAPAKGLPSPTDMSPFRQRCSQEQERKNTVEPPQMLPSPLACHTAGLRQSKSFPFVTPSKLPPGLPSTAAVTKAGPVSPCFFFYRCFLGGSIGGWGRSPFQEQRMHTHLQRPACAPRTPPFCDHKEGSPSALLPLPLVCVFQGPAHVHSSS